MTTMEKLFVQIFERKNWIIEQVKQHTDLYTHQQVSKLIIEGITPHPSLWNPNSHSQSSDPKELNKEELISKILLRQPRELVPYSSGVCSLYYGTVATGDNGGISNGLCMETNASNNGLNARDGPTIVLDDRDNDVGCTLNCVPEQDGIVNSTQDEIDVRISNIYTAPDKSLARIQRSKSRQKALELRTSAKAASKSCLSHKIETRISFSGVSSSKTGLHEADQNKSSSKSPNHFGTNRGSSVLRDANEANCSKGHDRSSYNGRVTRSRSSYKQPTIANECIEVDGSSEMEKEVNSMPVLSTDYSLQQSDQVNCLMEMMNPPDATFGSCGVREATTGNTWDKQRGSNVYCGRITRSRSSSQQASGINESSKPGASSYNAKECSGTLAQSIGNIMQQVDASSELMEAVKPSGELIDKMIRTRATCSNKDTLKPISYSNIAACLVTRSRSGATKESLNEVEGYALQNALGGKIIPFNFDVDREGNAEIAVVTEVVDGPVQMQPVYSGSNLDDVNLRMELKGLVSSPPPNDYMAVEPKQLDFDTEECNLNEIFSPPSTNRRLGKSSEKAYSTSLELAASADAVTHDNPNQSFFEHESSVGMNVARKPEEAWKHSDVNVEECIEDKISKFGSNIKENPTVKIVKYDSTAIHNENSCVLHVADITPSDIPGNNFDEEVHPEKCQLTEGYRSSLKMLIEEGDLGYKSKNESAATLCISKLKYSEASCSSSLAKQRTDYSQDCLDKEVRIHEATELLGEDEIVGCPKSTELESGKLTLPNMSFNSAKADSWPRYKRRKVEDQQNCFSTSGGFRVQLTHNIKKDTVNRDLKALEGDLGYKSKNESEATLCISKPKYSEASFSSSLAKQRTDYSQDCLDKEVRIHEATELLGEDEIVGCPKSTELESGQLTLPNMSFNSAKADSWPQYKRRKVEDQQNCFSTTEGFRVQLTQNIKKDTVNRDLRALENDSDSLEFQLVSLSEERYVFQSNANTSCDSEIHQKMKCHLTEGIESSHTLQTAEGFGFEVENKTAETPFTFKHLRPTCASNLAKKASDNPTDIVVEDVETADLTSKDYPPVCHDEDRVNMVNADIMTVERNLPERKAHVRGDGLLSYCSVGSPNNSDKNLIGPDETMPVFEGFIIDEHTENVGVDMTGCGIDFGSLDFPSTAFERASILEQICKFTSMQTPLSHYSSSLELNSMQDLHRSVPNGLLEHVDLRSTLPLNEDAGQHLCSSYSCVDEVNSTVQGLPNSDFLPFSGTPFSWKSKIHYASPVGNLWERFSSSSGSSEKRLSSNPELTCFPIEEDPSSNEENDNAEEVADEIEEACGPGVVDDFAEREPLAEITEACVNPGNSVAAGEKFPDRGSLDSCYTEVSFPGTHKKIKQKVRNHCSTKRSRDEGKEDQTPSFGHRITRGNVSLYQEFCKPKLSSKTSLRNGVQRLSQKEAKRNNIVSNMTSFIPLVHKKQAAAVCSGKRDIKVKSLEVAEAAKRREEEKEKERKMKKEALKLERARIEKENLREMELNKKKRQAEQKKRDADKASRKRQREEEERKRKHVAEARREQKLQNEKLRAGKLEKEKLRGKTDKKVNSSKESDNASGKNQGDKEGADENSFEKPDIELRTGGISTSDVQQVSTIFEDCHASSDCGGDRKGMSMFETSAKKVDLVTSTSQEKSYDMSPYQCSDDEEEEDDDVPTKKFVPAWASKINVALLLPLQQKLVPKTLFPLESFCSMDEVLLPRRLQLK